MVNNIDVACISNFPSNTSLKFLRKFLGEPIDGNFFKPMHYNFLDVNGVVISINSGPSDLMSPKGIKEARRQFIAALNSIKDSGVKVVLLAASLKRLFGHDAEEIISLDGTSLPVGSNEGQTIKNMYPDIIFTNGDNGTSVILFQEIDYLLEKAQIKKGFGRVVVFGAGILGIKAIKHLFDLGLDDHQIIIVSSFVNGLKEFAKEHDVVIVPTLQDVDVNVDAILSCTHKTAITADDINMLECKYVLDVAVPAGFPEHEYSKTRGVYRQDAGNAYSPNLNYQFEPEWIDLGSKNEMYGCFAEATAIAQRIKTRGYDFSGVDLRSLQWFDVNDENSAIAAELFSSYEFTRHPIPLCFGMPV